MDNIYTIYRATNTINGKCYVGFDSRWPHRKSSHISKSTKSYTPEYNYHIQRAIRKYGCESFVWEILYQSKDRDHTLKVMEPYFILENNSAYNMTRGGEGFTQKHREESKQKMRVPRPTTSLYMKQNNPMKNPDVMERANVKKRGRKQSPEFVEKRRLAMIGIKRSKEAKENIRQGAFKREAAKRIALKSLEHNLPNHTISF